MSTNLKRGAYSRHRSYYQLPQREIQPSVYSDSPGSNCLIFSGYFICYLVDLQYTYVIPVLLKTVLAVERMIVGKIES